MGVLIQNCICVTAVLLMVSYCTLAQPSYSLQNMPQTRFSCYDKILGGYYADAETQCQMFHVCVKVAGVGVQDFRFLCPNGTAFDQEAQICADWGDVDCEQSILYYGSDNFDLYRIGSGFESKRAPLAEEDESTFHLQRAESGDIRRSKETRIDQKSRPDQPPNYAKRFESSSATTTTSTRNSFNSNNNNNNNNNANFNGNIRIHHNNNNKNNSQQQQHQRQHPLPTQQVVHKVAAATLEPETTKRPIVSYYTPTTTSPPPPTTPSTTTTQQAAAATTTRSFNGNGIAAASASSATPTSANEQRYNDNNNNNESKQDFYDDIFKGSHSSHFFANRNGGREDDFIDHPHPQQQQQHHPNAKPKYNDLHNEFNRKDAKSRTPPTPTPRAKRPVSSTTTTPEPTTLSTAKVHKKVASVVHKVHGNANALNVAPTQKNASNVRSQATATASNYKTQEHIQPTTYNPGHNNIYRLKATTPKYAPTQQRNGKPDTLKPLEGSQVKSKPTAAANARKTHKYTESARESNFQAPNEFSEFTKIKPQQPNPQLQPQPQPQPFRPTDKIEKTETIGRVQPQYFRTRGRGGETLKAAAVEKQEPAPFSTAQSPTTSRTFASRGSINYKATTQQQNNDYYTSTTASGAGKKFSTLVPKELYTPPTTFKPTGVHKKTFEHAANYYQTQQTVRPAAPQGPAVSSTTSATPTTVNPYYNIDEDDGQYHPELYESDFPHNRANVQRTTTSTSKAPVPTPRPTLTTTTKRPQSFNLNYENAQSHLKTQQQSAFQKQQELSAAGSDLSDEDELFKTAHSLNFGAASINKLRADIIKAEKTSQQYNSQYSPNHPVTATSPKPFTVAVTSKPFVNSVYTTYAVSTTTSIPTTSTTTTTITSTTTRRPPTINPVAYSTKKPTKPSKGKKATKLSSKRPPHADEDTSYDYAYYDTDTLSESPQDYADYEFAEFKKTRRN